VPISHSIDLEISAVIGSAEGVLEDRDLFDYARRLLEDPDVKLARHELVDLTRADPASKITSDAVRRLAEFWRGEYGNIAGGKLAIVAPRDLSFGLSRMYQGLRSDGPDNIQVFRDPEEARAWLAGS